MMKPHGLLESKNGLVVAGLTLETVDEFAVVAAGAQHAADNPHVLRDPDSSHVFGQLAVSLGSHCRPVGPEATELFHANTPDAAAFIEAAVRVARLHHPDPETQLRACEMNSAYQQHILEQKLA